MPRVLQYACTEEPHFRHLAELFRHQCFAPGIPASISVVLSRLGLRLFGEAVRSSRVRGVFSAQQKRLRLSDGSNVVSNGRETTDHVVQFPWAQRMGWEGDSDDRFGIRAHGNSRFVKSPPEGVGTGIPGTSRRRLQ